MTTEKLLTDTRTVIVSVNPNSGSRDRGALVEELCEELVRLNYTPVVLTEIARGVAETLRLQGTGELRAVVAAGGDGTVSLLANELPPEIAFAILPLGTENLLAKYLGLTADPDRIAQLIDAGETARLDAGRANGRLFLVMASCGFDADVVSRLHSNRKGHIRHSSYVRPIVDAIVSYRYPKIRFWVDESTKSFAGRWAFVFNVPRYAMNLPIVDDADSMDGELDLCTFRGGNLLRGLLYLVAVLTKQHRRWNESKIKRFKKLRIESDEPVPYQLDGDPGGVLPLEIEVQSKFLRVVVSNDWIVKNGGC